MSFRVKPISANIVDEVRRTMVSPQHRSLPAFSSVANGYGPCRSCLRTFDEGNEDRTSFTYDPFAGRSNLPQPGPVFVHTRECQEFAAEGFPAGLRQLPMYFEGFAPENNLISRVRVEPDQLESQIEQIFHDPLVDFIYVRNAEAGCFIAQIDRG